MRLILALLTASTGCTTASTLAEDFVKPVEEQIGDQDNPEPGTIEARLDELEAQVASLDATQLETRVTVLEDRLDDSLNDIDDASALAQEALDLATGASARADEALDRLRDASRVEIWGVNAYADRRVFNPDGSSGRAWTFPTSRYVPAKLRLEYSECDAVLLQISAVEGRASGDPTGLIISSNEALEKASYLYVGGTFVDDQKGLGNQIWVATGGSSQLYVRTVSGAEVGTIASIYHQGCASAL